MLVCPGEGRFIFREQCLLVYFERLLWILPTTTLSVLKDGVLKSDSLLPSLQLHHQNSSSSSGGGGNLLSNGIAQGILSNGINKSLLMEQHQQQQSRLHQHHQVGTLTLLGLVQRYIKDFYNIVIINYVQVDMEGLLVKARLPLRKHDDYLMTVTNEMTPLGNESIIFKALFIRFWSKFQ